MFVLDGRLAADTVVVGDLALCRVLLMKNRLWPWLILVPTLAGLREVHELGPKDRACLIEEAALASEVLERLHAPDKLNVAAIGNLVPQFHLHVVARRVGDAAWPNPVWGSGRHEPYDPGTLDVETVRLRTALGL